MFTISPTVWSSNRTSGPLPKSRSTINDFENENDILNFSTINEFEKEDQDNLPDNYFTTPVNNNNNKNNNLLQVPML